MSVHEVIMYEIVCDEPGCTFKTDSLGEYSAWGDDSTARDQWVDSDQQEVKVAGVPMHYCDNHRHPACMQCEEIVSIVLDKPDGDLYCPQCLAILYPPQVEQFDLTPTHDGPDGEQL